MTRLLCLLLTLLFSLSVPAMGEYSDFWQSSNGGTTSEAAALVGRLGNPMNVPGPQNVCATMGGREFSELALDQMQGRGIMPSAVDNTIQQGTNFPTRAGTTGFYDSVNDVRVIVNSENGRVVTVIPGAP